MAEDKDQYEELLHWAAAQGIKDAPPVAGNVANTQAASCLGFSLRVAEFPDAGGRGLAAARDLNLGDLILRVPEKALMNGRSARQDTELARVLSAYPSLTAVQVLCLHLLMEVAKGRKSAWYPYLVNLPRIHHTAAYYTSFESQALQVEEAMWMGEQAAEKSRKEWVEARMVMKKLGLSRRFTTQHAWLWASATVSSRTLFVPWDEAGTLCPIGDYFNYACPGVSYCVPVAIEVTPQREESNSEDDLDPLGGLQIGDRLRDGGFEFDRGEYCFYARQDYQMGQQVLLCYGTYTNLDLLEHYGFLLPYNPNDKVHMGLPSIGELRPGDSWVSQEVIPVKNLYIDYEGRPSFSLLAHLRLTAAPAALRKTHRHIALAGQQISVKSDLASYQWLKAKCSAMLVSFATTMDVDEMLVAILRDHHSTEEVEKFLLGYGSHCGSTPPVVLPQEIANTSEEVQGVVRHQLEEFIMSVSVEDPTSQGSTLEGKCRLERWKLAVEWRLGYKKILDRCVSYCIRMLKVLNP